jgi:hypothetical protein
MGPMTGRAAGYCAGYAVPGYMNPVGGGGFWGWGRGGGWGGGRGWGRGRGYRNWYYATGLPGWQRAAMGAPAWGAPWGAAPAAPYAAPSPEQEAEGLKAQAEYFQQALEDIRKRIEELETQDTSKKK